MMKRITGVFILLLTAALAVVIILRIWGISVISRGNMLRSGATLLVLAAAIIALTIIWALFMPRAAKGYNVNNGNRAHPKS